MPDWRQEIRLRLIDLKLGPIREAEIVEELSQHLEDRYNEWLAAGATPEEASRAALAELSESETFQKELRRVERQASQEPATLGANRRNNMLGDLWQDLRYGLRALRKNPGFTAVATLMLALGIGANTAIFTVIDALMLKPLPVRSPEQLVVFKKVFPNGASSSFSYLEYERFLALRQVFSGALAITGSEQSNVRINGAGGAPPIVDEGQARVDIVTGNYFSMLGVTAALGRTFTEDDDRAEGGHPVTVISDGYWERKFGRSPDVVGRALTLNGVTFDIIGVAPRGFSGDWVGRRTDLWFPVAMLFQVRPELPPAPRGSHRISYRVVARLKPGTPIEQAQAAGQVTLQQILTEAAGVNLSPQQKQRIERTRFEVEPAATGFSPQRESFAQPLAILMILVGAVLLIACANVANLLLARAASRRREMAVRLAVGASRGRIARQLFTESLLLAVIGGALGLLFAWWATDVLAMLVRSGPVGGWALSADLDMGPDRRMLAFTLALCLLTGVLFGLAPSLRGSRASLSFALGYRGSGSGDSACRFGLGNLLVIAQVALSLALLIGAGLFVRTLRNLKAQDLGFDREQVLLVWTQLGQTGRKGLTEVEKGGELASLYGIVQERVSSLPGVRSASPSVHGMLSGGSFGGPSLKVEGYTPRPNENPVAQYHIVGPGFFETVGQRLLRGRDFTERDTAAAPPVAVINESMARHFFGNDNPIGKRFTFDESGAPPVREIVGVVTDANYNSPREEKDRMRFYYPYQQEVPAHRLRLTRMCLAVRASGDPSGIVASVRQELRNIDPGLATLKMVTIEEQINDLLFQERLIVMLSSFFGSLAVLLACLGLYGVMSYRVTRRTNEIGVRLALGATPTRVLLMVLKESLALALAGVVIGVPVTLAGARLISNSLFGVGAADPLTIAVATSLLLTVAAVAALLPAYRAARVDPMVALRCE